MATMMMMWWVTMRIKHDLQKQMASEGVSNSMIGTDNRYIKTYFKG